MIPPYAYHKSLLSNFLSYYSCRSEMAPNENIVFYKEKRIEVGTKAAIDACGKSFYLYLKISAHILSQVFRRSSWRN